MVQEVKTERKKLDKLKTTYYNLSEEIKKTDRDLTDLAIKAKSSPQKQQSDATNRIQKRLEALIVKKQEAQIQYHNQVDRLNEHWRKVHRTVNTNSELYVDHETKGRDYIESRVKLLADIIIGFGIVDNPAETSNSRELIRKKPEYSFEGLGVYDEPETQVLRFLGRRIIERFESFEEHVKKKAFWTDK